MLSFLKYVDESVITDYDKCTWDNISWRMVGILYVVMVFNKHFGKGFGNKQYDNHIKGMNC